MQTRHHRRITFAFAFAVVAVAVPVTGCGSSGSPSASGTTAASGTATSSAGKTIDLCSLIPPATVAQLTGQQVTTGAEDSGDKMLASSGIFNCNYTGATGGTAQVDLDVTTKNGKIAYDSELQADQSVSAAGTKQISGLGDKAFSAIDGVHALFGDVEIKVSGFTLAVAAAGTSSNDPTAGAEALIKAVHAKL